MSNLDNAYALLIGVGADLAASVRDASSIAKLLADPNLAGYKKENIHLLTEKEATRGNILNAFDQLIEKVDEDSSVLLFYSGHGGRYTDNDIIELEYNGDGLKPEELNEAHYYWVPNDFDAKRYRETWLLATELKERLNKLKTRRLILLLDCCHAEGMTKKAPELRKSNSLKERLSNPEGMIHKIDDGRGMSILSSCRAEELSWIIPKTAENSLFTTCLLEVLQGNHKEGFNEDYIRMTDVINHIMRKVPEVKDIQRPFVTLQMYDDFILSKNSRIGNSTSATSSAVNSSTSKKNVGELVSSFRENHGVNAVIFVHGFSGQAHSSFGEIPKLLEQDPKMDGWDLFPLGFSENFTPEMGYDIWASKLDLQKLADNIASSLRYKFKDYKRVALIGHSLGGLAIQMALLQLNEEERKRISHVIFMGTPNNGILINEDKDPDKRMSQMDQKSSFISQLRSDWNATFNKQTPFKLMNAVGTQDSIVSIDTSFGVFEKENDVLVSGDHFSMVLPDDTQHDGYQLIVKTLTDSAFANKYTNKQEINLLLGDYDAIVKDLWPERDELGAKGTKNLLFALEGLDRLDEAIELAEGKVESKASLHLLGLLAGRVKRRFLKTMKEKDGDLSYRLYKRAFDLAVKEENNDQQYFLAINLAFLSLIHEEDRAAMQKFATLSRKLAQKDPFDSIWKSATIAEASLYLADFETAKEQYTLAAKEAGVREKISMHANAYLAYTTLKHTKGDEFVTFLKQTFLS